MTTPLLEQLIAALAAECRAHYGASLVALALFGSVGRGTPRPDSDVDVLIVADNLPHGRVARAADFVTVERHLGPSIRAVRERGLAGLISPVFKTPAEIAAGSPLLFDMVADARILFDRDAFLRRSLDDLGTRLARLGARRIWKGSAWIWDLKPDYRPGEIFEL